MNPIDANENYREKWMVKNLRSSPLTIAEFKSFPTLSASQELDILRYYSKERVGQSKTIMTLVKNRWIQVTRVRDGVSTVADFSTPEPTVTPAYLDELSGGGGGGGTSYFTLSGTTYVGGDQSATDARGANALDVQGSRGDPTQAAVGDNSVAVGINCRSESDTSVAVGNGNYATGVNALAMGVGVTSNGSNSVVVGYNSMNSFADGVGLGSNVTIQGTSGVGVGQTVAAQSTNSVAVGLNSTAGGTGSVALGQGCTTSSLTSGAAAIGVGSRANISNTANISTPLIVRQDAAVSAAAQFYTYGGTEVVLFSNEVDLKVAATTTITLPSGASFWVNEVGVIATQLTAITTQPTISFGITGTNAKYKAAAVTTKLTAVRKRERYTSLLTDQDGETTLTATVTSAAVGTTLKGRFYFKGLLVEN